MNCIQCNSSHVHKDGVRNGYQRYKCLECHKRFTGEKVDVENSYFVHFNTRLKKTDRILLTRDNYFISKKEINYDDRKLIQYAKQLIESSGKPPMFCPSFFYNFPNKMFEDEGHYTDSYIEKYYKIAMINYDLNMRYFEALDYELFNQYLQCFVKKKGFIEIIDLKEVAGKKGAYIMVLDRYMQAYIGISDSEQGIKGRILKHWRKQKEFNRLVYGKIENSIISIDSFGALDTTRIFYKELNSFQNLDDYERKLVDAFKPEYRLNRVAGGINGENNGMLRNLKLITSVQKRKL